MLITKEERHLTPARSIAVIIVLSIAIISLMISTEAVMALPAENETPKSHEIAIFRPYAWQTDLAGRNGHTFLETAGSHQGYTIEKFEQKVETTNPMDAHLIKFYYLVKHGYGVIYVHSHGSTRGFAVESYGTAADAKAKRDAQYRSYTGMDELDPEVWEATDHPLSDGVDNDNDGQTDEPGETYIPANDDDEDGMYDEGNGDPPGDANGDGAPGVIHVDDDNDGQGFIPEEHPVGGKYEIYRACAEDVGPQDKTSYHISVHCDAIAQWFKDAKTIVYNACCKGHAYSGKWTGARDVLAYDICPSTGDNDAQLFWGRMDGTLPATAKGTRRPVSKALNPRDGINPRLKHTGAGNTVLSPKVKSHGGSPVVFDCKMDTTIPPQQVVTATGATLTNVKWIGDDTITFTVTFTDIIATFTVHADKAISGNNEAKLDGNQNPEGTDGVGPNGDDYIYTQIKPDGGIVVPVDKFGLLASNISATLAILVAAVAAAVCTKSIKRMDEKQ